MTNQMIALAKSKPEPGLWQVDASVPEIGPDDVLIKINKTGICGTDIYLFHPFRMFNDIIVIIELDEIMNGRN